jgi:hypothetical protein
MIRILFLATVLAATTVDAREVHVIGGFARGADISYCLWLNWESDVLFYNVGATPAVVRVLNVSNGSIDAPTDTLMLPPRTVISLRASDGKFWIPQPREHGFVPLWVWRFEVPDTVQVTSFLELHESNCAIEGFGAVRGQITLPTFDRLVPGGQEQVFLGTDLGNRDRRVNVAVYNTGPAAATA